MITTLKTSKVMDRLYDGVAPTLKNQDFWSQYIADDLVISNNGKSWTLCELIQRTSSLAQGWCKQVGLTVNPNKTAAILITKNKNLKGFIKPTLFGEVLELQNQVENLGKMLDFGENWNNHIDQKLSMSVSNYKDLGK
jgi:hypothetical protein